MLLDPIPIREAAQISGLPERTIRHYVATGKLSGFRKANRIHVSRRQINDLIAPVPLGAVPSPRTGETRIIAVANQKGGTGKTTTAVALATILAREAPVLAIDCDPQGNMTQAFGFNPDLQDPTLYNILVDNRPIKEALLKVAPPPAFLQLIPANLDLADVSRRVAGKIGLEGLLRKALQSIVPDYHYCVLDCPPSLDLITMNALVAATEVIVPVDMSVFSVRGMLKLMGTLEEVRTVNPNLPPPRIVACRTTHSNFSTTIEETLRENFVGRVFSTTIPTGSAVPEAHGAKRPLPYYAPDSKPAQAYERLAEEMLHG